MYRPPADRRHGLQDLEFGDTAVPMSRGIKFHGTEDYEGMRRAGRLAAEVLDFIAPHVVPGVTTGQLDTLCHRFIVDHGAIAAPLSIRVGTESRAHHHAPRTIFVRAGRGCGGIHPGYILGKMCTLMCIHTP